MGGEGASLGPSSSTVAPGALEQQLLASPTLRKEPSHQISDEIAGVGLQKTRGPPEFWTVVTVNTCVKDWEIMTGKGSDALISGVAVTVSTRTVARGHLKCRTLCLWGFMNPGRHLFLLSWLHPTHAQPQSPASESSG